ncbi:regulator of volume decrease after cellular swelling-domain-containing protein [Auriculariales sp. MPI-PUGE-AT-0066]|nr:regulator of volume decrease after cellular swelling-domain-containing protein [Auriculariales sp. MPI-PUGE-AT-0066]
MPLTIIEGPPPFTTPEHHRQLTSATPDSFDSIPPIIRHKDDNVTLTLDPPLDQIPSQNASGTLYVTEKVVAFVGPDGRGFSVDYPTLILHAISRAEDGPLLYCQLDESIGTEQADDEDVDGLREIRIKPSSPDTLETLFEAISLCASLNTDNVPDDEDDENDDAFIDANEGEFQAVSDEAELSEVGRAALAYMESIIDWDHPASRPRPDQSLQHDASAESNAAGTNGASGAAVQSPSPAAP